MWPCVLSSFLSQGEGYAPQSGQLTGILKEMKDTMDKSLADCTAAEESSKTIFEALVAAKAKEIATNTNLIEKETQRHLNKLYSPHHDEGQHCMWPLCRLNSAMRYGQFGVASSRRRWTE